MQVLYGVNQRIRSEDVDSPLAAIRPVKTVTLVLITGDRGLCGGYNNFAIKKVRITKELHLCTHHNINTHDTQCESALCYLSPCLAFQVSIYVY